MKRTFPLPGLIAMLSLLWLALLGVTVWAWMAGRGMLPGVQAPQAPEAGGGAITLVWNADAFQRLLGSLQWAGLALAGFVLVAVVVGAAVQENARRSSEAEEN